VKIECLRSEKIGDKIRASSTVSWEDCDRPTEEIYFETTTEFGHGFSCNPHSFLLACFLPAAHYGEQRIYLDAEICPALREGLHTALAWIGRWYGAVTQPRIEVKKRVTSHRAPARAGLIFLGGHDYLVSLQTNRRDFSAEHPGFFRDGLILFGLYGEDWELCHAIMDHLSDVSNEMNLIQIPIYTNSRQMVDNWGFWGKRLGGAVRAAAAHAFDTRLTTISICSYLDIPTLPPNSNHPLLIHNYASHELVFRQENARLSMASKLRMLSQWKTGLNAMKVCSRLEFHASGRTNCGQCEHCVMTMLHLLALGLLSQTTAFPSVRITEDLIDSAIHPWEANRPIYPELIDLLKQKGYDDLARKLEQKVFGPRGITGIRRRVWGLTKRVWTSVAVEGNRQRIS
jgi:hypothetical protein